MLSGSQTANSNRHVQFGPGSRHLLPSILRDLLTPPFPPAGQTEVVKPEIRVMIVTGRSLNTKTPLVRELEEILRKEGMYGLTLADVGEFAPIADIQRGRDLVDQHNITALVSLGGGSPIDAAKAIAYFHRQTHSLPSFLPHIAIPTTLSVAETGQNAGYKGSDGHKTGANHPLNAPLGIIYDAEVTKWTPRELLLSTGLRAIDHAVEGTYRVGISPVMKQLGRHAVRGLMQGLRAVKAEKEGEFNMEARNLLVISAWESLWPATRTGSMGLSHQIGHKLGATYSIPHGFCSCLTLPPTIHLMSTVLPSGSQELLDLASIAPYVPSATSSSGLGPTTSIEAPFDLSSDEGQREAVRFLADAVGKLVEDLGLKRTLDGYGVPRGDLEGIAGRVMDGGKVWVGDVSKGGVVGILEGIYGP